MHTVGEKETVPANDDNNNNNDVRCADVQRYRAKSSFPTRTSVSAQ